MLMWKLLFCMHIVNILSFFRTGLQGRTVNNWLVIPCMNIFGKKIPAQRLVTRSFDVFFDLRPNKRLSKQSLGWWSEAPSHPLWRHCNGQVGYHLARDCKTQLPAGTWGSLKCSRDTRHRWTHWHFDNRRGSPGHSANVTGNTSRIQGL